MASTRKKVSTREYLDSKGEKSVGPDAAGLVRYTLLNDAGEPIKVFPFSPGDAGTEQLAQFGFVTKVGNVANSVLNGESPGTVEEAAAEIEAFISALADGQWREPGQPRAPKWDKDLLAAVIFDHLTTLGKAKGDLAHYRTRLDDAKYFAAVTRGAGDAESIRAEYDRRAPKREAPPARPVAVDELA